MAISKLLHILNGLVQTTDLVSQELQVDSITVGGASGTNLTKTILDGLVSNSHASGSDNQNVTAGDGLTGGGSGATPTLAVGAGNGISVTADAVAVSAEANEGITVSGSGVAVDYDDATIGIVSNKLAVKADGIGAGQIRLANNANLKARNAADSGDVSIVKVNASDKIEFASIPQASGTPSAASDLTNKSYVDQVVITGAHLREAVLLSSQLSDAQGILAAEVIYFANAPIEDDTVIVKNGTNTYTYTFKDSPTGNYQVQTNASAVVSMTNLANKIHSNLATDDYDATFMADGLDAINSAGVVVVFEKASASGASTSRIYGVWATQADAKVVAFNGDTEYSTKAGASMAAADPAAVRFGIRKQASALVPGEFHASLGDSIVKGWNGDSNAWFTLNGSGSLPDATSASGGGTKGKVTFDSDKGLSVGSGIAEVKIDNSSIGFGSGGDIGKLLVKASGVTNDMLAGSIADGKLSTITTSNKVSGSAVQLKSTGALEDSTGLAVKVDGVTITINGSNQLEAAAATSVSSLVKGMVAGESFAANTSFLVRFALTGETAGRVYKATNATAATDGKCYAIGIIMSTSALSAGDDADVKMVGTHALGSSDSSFAAGDVGKAVYLTTAGGFSTTAPSSSGSAVYRVGIVEGESYLFVGTMQLNGIN